MDTDWIHALAAVAEHGSFTAAARNLRLSKQSVSRRVALLEEYVGASLITRSTRAVALTPQGRAFLERASEGLASLADALDAVRWDAGELSDHLRVGAPALFGRRFLNPVVIEFMTQHPGIQVTVESLGESNVSALSRLDLMVHVGDPPHVAAKRIALGQAVNLLVTSAAHPIERPSTPEGLTTRSCVVYSRRGVPVQRWCLERDDQSLTVDVRPRYQSNDVDCAIGAVEAGLGIAHLPGFLAAEGIREGRFVHVLPEWRVVVGPIWALYRPSRSPRHAFDLFAEALRAHFRQPGHRPSGDLLASA